MDSEHLLDALDRQLLRELQDNARLTYTELGRRVGLTPPAVAERLRRLEETGVIVGYRAELNPEKLGLPVMALIRITIPGEGKCKAFGGVVQQWPEVVEAHRVAGSDSYIMKVLVPSVRRLEALIDRLGEHGQTTTSVVLSTPLSQRRLEPAD